jgi:hypothetical protein
MSINLSVILSIIYHYVDVKKKIKIFILLIVTGLSIHYLKSIINLELFKMVIEENLIQAKWANKICSYVAVVHLLNKANFILKSKNK